MKSTRTPDTLLKQLKGAAKSEFLNLAVGFKTECKFIDSREANARETLKAMMKAGGEPIGFIDAEAKRLTIHALQEYANDAHAPAQTP
jgi:hypothetical protein